MLTYPVGARHIEQQARTDGDDDAGEGRAQSVSEMLKRLRRSRGEAAGERCTLLSLHCCRSHGDVRSGGRRAGT